MKTLQDGMMFLIMLGTFIVFAYMDWRYLDIEFLEFTRGDEYPQFLQLQKMYEGLLEFDYKKFFAFEFYNYGFIWYLLNLIAVIPFKIYPNYELAIYAPRILNAIINISIIWIIYKIARIYLNSKKALLLSIFTIAMPGFWQLGYTFKPDATQALLLLCGVYFLCKDRFGFAKNYWYGLLFFALALGAAKFQAIMFLPLIYAYIFYLFIKTPKLATFYLVVKKSIFATFFTFIAWIITNPYLLHPRGFLAWLDMFEGNMHSNATNHGTYTNVSLMDKVFSVVDFYYFWILVFCALIIVCLGLLLLSIKILKNPQLESNIKSSIFIPICIGFIISLFYLFFAVNKAWEAYYYSTICLGIVLFIPMVLYLEKIKKIGFVKLNGGGGLAIVIVLQIFGGIMNQSYIQVFTKYNRDMSTIKAKSDALYELIVPYFSNLKNPVNVLIDTPFAYLQFGLKPTNIYRPYGRLNKENFIFDEWSKKPHTLPFIPKDFIILKKDSVFFTHKNQNINKNLQESIQTLKELESGVLPYRKIIDTDEFIVFLNIDSRHTNL